LQSDKRAKAGKSSSAYVSMNGNLISLEEGESCRPEYPAQLLEAFPSVGSRRRDFISEGERADRRQSQDRGSRLTEKGQNAVKRPPKLDSILQYKKDLRDRRGRGRGDLIHTKTI